MRACVLIKNSESNKYVHKIVEDGSDLLTKESMFENDGNPLIDVLIESPIQTINDCVKHPTCVEPIINKSNTTCVGDEQELCPLLNELNLDDFDTFMIIDDDESYSEFTIDDMNKIKELNGNYDVNETGEIVEYVEPLNGEEDPTSPEYNMEFMEAEEIEIESEDGEVYIGLNSGNNYYKFKINNIEGFKQLISEI